MSEIIAQRCFQPIYIVFDSIFLLCYLGLLIWKKKYSAVVVGLLAGVLYQIVDFGIFHLLCHSRSITEGYSLFWVLFWMSMSYGFTNFTWIWLALSKDRHLIEWSLLILVWWFVCPMLAGTFGHSANPIVIQRTTSEYHGGMAIILLIGYAGAIIWNLCHREKEQQVPLLRLLAIGIGIQLAWELSLLIGGIRSAEITDWGQKLKILAVNSLLETNLGMPYVYFLHRLYTRKRNAVSLQKEQKRLK